MNKDLTILKISKKEIEQFEKIKELLLKYYLYLNN